MGFFISFEDAPKKPKPPQLRKRSSFTSSLEKPSSDSSRQKEASQTLNHAMLTSNRGFHVSLSSVGCVHLKLVGSFVLRCWSFKDANYSKY